MSELFGQAPSSQLTPSERLNAAALLVQAETLEGFMAKKFPSFKVPPPPPTAQTIAAPDSRTLPPALAVCWANGLGVGDPSRWLCGAGLL